MNRKIDEFENSGKFRNKVLQNIDTRELLKLTINYIDEQQIGGSEIQEICHEIYPELPKLSKEDFGKITDIISSYLLDYLINVEIRENRIQDRIWVNKT